MPELPSKRTTRSSTALNTEEMLERLLEYMKPMTQKINELTTEADSRRRTTRTEEITAIEAAHRLADARHSLERQSELPYGTDREDEEEEEVHQTKIPIPKAVYVKLPEFNNESRNAEGFLAACDEIFEVTYPRLADRAKIISIGRTLRGEAAEWYQTYATGPRPSWMLNYRLFQEQFVKDRGDPYRRQNAAREFNELQQGKMSVADYTAKFKRYITILGYTDDPIPNNMLTHAYYNGLRPSIKDRITDAGRKTTLQELYVQAHEMGSREEYRRQERLQEQQRSGFVPMQPRYRYPTNLYTPRPVPIYHYASRPPVGYRNPTGPTTGTGYRPPPVRSTTSVNSTATGMIRPSAPVVSQAERDQRRQQSLCYRCGNQGHIVKDCPLRTESEIRARSVTFDMQQEGDIQHHDVIWEELPHTVEETGQEGN
ncbi:unnamed protein product [Cutaneotrichosporon oleaginosum]